MTATYEERARHFNETTGVFGYTSIGGFRLGANHHPDRCRCQGDPFPGDGRGNSDAIRTGRHNGEPYADTTPHKHRDKPPFSCARCFCPAYVPHDEARKDDLRLAARAIVAESVRGRPRV